MEHLKLTKIGKNWGCFFIRKTLFFPKERILVIGDLHFGFDILIRKAGIPLYKNQIEEIENELIDIYKRLKSENFNIEKIVFLGDIKHSFSYESLEKKYLCEFFEFIKKEIKIEEKNIILIKGNHDTFNYQKSIPLRDYFLFNKILFIHGDKYFEKLKNKDINLIVTGHLHPSIILKDKSDIKHEKFKCFLVGKIKSKIVIILPSFLNASDGINIFDFKNQYDNSFSIFEKKDLLNFEAYVVGEKEVYNFGKIKNF